MISKPKKSILKSIFSNTLWLLIAEVIFKGAITIISIILARTLPLEEFGTYSVAFSFTALFTFLADFGIATVTTRDISQDLSKAHRILSQSLPLKLLLSLVSSIAIIILAIILGRRSADLILTILFAFYVGINSLNIFLHAYFRANLNMKFEAISKIIQGIFLITIATIGIIFTNIYIVAGGFIVSTIIALGYLYYQITKSIPSLSIQWDTRESVNLLRNSWMYGLSGFLALINLNFDAVMIGFTVSNELAGIYTAIYTILVALTFVMNIAFVPLFTIIARKSSDKVFLRSALIKLTMIMGIIGSIIGITIYILRQYILDILYGGEISLYPHILTVLSLVFVLSALRWPAGYILAAIGKQKIYLVILLISAFCNILLNIIFIPQFGIIAAAWTTVISEIINLIGSFIAVWIITQKSQPS